jgi:uncharacterized damage-inducible protein DinB
VFIRSRIAKLHVHNFNASHNGIGAFMTVQQLLAHQFGMMYGTAARNLERMTHEHSLVQPGTGGNCANWILGHLVNVQNGVMQVVGAEPVWQSEELKRAGFDPIIEPDNAIDFDTLKDRFLASREQCVTAIAGLSDEALAQELPDPFGGVTTRAQLLSVLSYHQAYHVGQIGIIRRIAGLEGAIKGPGQQRVGA